MANKHTKKVVKYYDATKEFAPFKREGTPSGRHPRPRAGATKAKRMGITRRAMFEQQEKAKG